MSEIINEVFGGQGSGGGGAILQWDPVLEPNKVVSGKRGGGTYVIVNNSTITNIDNVPAGTGKNTIIYFNEQIEKWEICSASDSQQVYKGTFATPAILESTYPAANQNTGSTADVLSTGTKWFVNTSNAWVDSGGSDDLSSLKIANFLSEFNTPTAKSAAAQNIDVYQKAAINTALDTKITKISNPVVNQIPLMDANGSLFKSDKLLSDFEPVITTKNSAFNKNYGTDVSKLKQNGVAAVGTEDSLARLDHIHPTDTTREAIANKVSSFTATPNNTNYITEKLAKDSLDLKVDKVLGKQLSTEDYTTAEKTKLAGIQAGAEVNVQANWNETNSVLDSFILNKPTLGTVASKNVGSAIGNIQENGAVLLSSQTVETDVNGKFITVVKNDAYNQTFGIGTNNVARGDASYLKANTYNKTEIDTQLSNKLDTSLKGVANGLAELGSDGKVPSSQLPAYVDDVIEVANFASLPTIGETGKIYVTIDTNLQYRWSGTQYVEISPSLALGETSSTAYRGDRGKIAYDHSQATGNPHGTTKGDVGLGNVDNTADINKNVLSATKLTTPRNINGVAFDGTQNITIQDDTKEPIFTKNTAFNKNFGNAIDTVTQGNDARLGTKDIDETNIANNRIQVYNTTTGKLEYQDLPIGSTNQLLAGNNITIDTQQVGNIFQYTINASGLVSYSELANYNYISNGNFSSRQQANTITHTGTGNQLSCADRFFVGRADGLQNDIISTRQFANNTSILKIQRVSGTSSVSKIAVAQGYDSETVQEGFAGRTKVFSFSAFHGTNYSGINGVTCRVYGSTTANDLTGRAATGFSTNALDASFTVPSIQSGIANIQRYNFLVAIPSNIQSLMISFEYTPVGTAGADDSFFIANLKSEIGTVATPFIYVPSHIVLDDVLPYYERIKGGTSGASIRTGNAFSDGTMIARATLFYRKTKRRTPTLVVSDNAAINILRAGTDQISTNITFSNTDLDTSRIDVTATPSTLSIGESSLMTFVNITKFIDVLADNLVLNV